LRDAGKKNRGPSKKQPAEKGKSLRVGDPKLSSNTIKKKRAASVRRGPHRQSGSQGMSIDEMREERLERERKR